MTAGFKRRLAKLESSYQKHSELSEEDTEAIAGLLLLSFNKDAEKASEAAKTLEKYSKEQIRQVVLPILDDIAANPKHPVLRREGSPEDSKDKT